MRILFLSHYGGRTGAPILLLEFQRWLRQHGLAEFRTVFTRGGPLLDEFRELGPVELSPLTETPGGSRVRDWTRRLTGRDVVGSLHQGRRLSELARWKPDIVYANTVATWRELEWLAPLQVPVLWHVHELSFWIRHHLGELRLRGLTPRVGRFVAASTSVATALIHEFSVPADKVRVVHESVRIRAWTPADKARHRVEVRRELGWPEDAFVVGGCGTTDWRKGADLFTVLAKRFHELDPGGPAGFLWIGSGGEVTDAQQRFSAEKAGLGSFCRFTGETDRPMERIAAMDVFALVSREDPFPLVMLEAGAMGIPTVCWADSGGGPEFVEADAGVAVPFLSIERFAGALRELQGNRARREAFGLRAAAKVAERYRVEVQAPKLLAEIKSLS